MQLLFRTKIVPAVAFALLAGTAPAVLGQAIDPSHYRMPVGGYYMPDPANPLNMLRTTDLQAALTAWRNDPEFKGVVAINWGPRALGADLMHALGYTGKNQKGGVIDTGSYADHPEFIDADGTRRVVGVDITFNRAFDDISGRATAGFNKGGDLVTTRGGLPSTGSDHGTHVMGIIVGSRNNAALSGVKLQGVAFGATGYAVQGEDIGPAEGPADTLDPNFYSAAMARLADLGVSVVNNSWGMGPYGKGTGTFSRGAAIQQQVTASSHIIEKAISDAAHRNVVTMFSAGNDRRSEPSDVKGQPYFDQDPVLERHFLTVLNGEKTADNQIKDLSWSSSVCGYTKWWCIVSPGEVIPAPVVSVTGEITPDGIHVAKPDRVAIGNKGGTSMAAPAAAGAYLLLKERFPELTNAQVLDVMKGTASRRMNVNGEVDEMVGLGIIDLAKAARGPGELFGVFDVNLKKDDLWSNDIVQNALDQRQQEELQEIAAWPARQQFLETLLAGRPEEAKARVNAHYQQVYNDNYADALALVRTLLTPTTAYPDAKDNLPALKAVRDNETASALFEYVGRRYSTPYPAASRLDAHVSSEAQQTTIAAMLADRPVDSLRAGDNVGLADAWARNNQANKTDELRAELKFMPSRIAGLQAKTYETGVIKRGAGTLEMSGDNSYRGDTVIKGGQIVLSGSTVSTTIAESLGLFTVTPTGVAADVHAIGGRAIINGTAGATSAEAGGLIGGTGTLASLNIVRGGILAPGNSIGTLNVSGDATLDASATYQVEVNGLNADRLAVGGTAKLNGTVIVSREGQIAALTNNQAANNGSSPYKIVTAGAVDGKFASALPNAVFVAANLAYTSTDVTLTLGRNGIAFADLATTDNARAGADAIDRLGLGNAVHNAIVTQNNAGLVRAAFNPLSGELHANAQAALLYASLQGTRAANNRLRAAFEATAADISPVLSYAAGAPVLSAPATEQAAIWWNGYGQWSDVKGNDVATGFTYSDSGMVFGVDNTFGDWRVGLMAGFGGGLIKGGDSFTSSKANSYQIGLYGGTEWGDIAFRTGLAYQWHNVSATRTVALPGLAETLTANYTTGGIQAFGELAYGVDYGAARFEPFINLTHIQQSHGGFVESGGAAALAVHAANATQTFTTIGLRAEHGTTLGDIDVNLTGMVGWRHAFGDANATTQNFAGGNAFSTSSAVIGKDALVLEAGVNFAASPNATFGIGYSGQFSSSSQDHAVKANLSVKF